MKTMVGCTNLADIDEESETDDCEFQTQNGLIFEEEQQKNSSFPSSEYIEQENKKLNEKEIETGIKSHLQQVDKKINLNNSFESLDLNTSEEVEKLELNPSSLNNLRNLNKKGLSYEKLAGISSKKGLNEENDSQKKPGDKPKGWAYVRSRRKDFKSPKFTLSKKNYEEEKHESVRKQESVEKESVNPELYQAVKRLEEKITILEASQSKRSLLQEDKPSSREQHQNKDQDHEHEHEYETHKEKEKDIQIEEYHSDQSDH
jgi:hypothetical protein